MGEVGDWTSMDITKYRGRFDCLLAQNCAHFFGARTAEGFRNIASVLRPGGIVIGQVEAPNVMGEAAPAMMAETFKAGYTPGIFSLEMEKLDGVVINAKPRLVKNKEWNEQAQKAVGAMYGLTRRAVRSGGRLVAEEHFFQIVQVFTPALLRTVLGEAGLVVQDLYITDKRDHILDEGNPAGTHISFVARKPA